MADRFENRKRDDQEKPPEPTSVGTALSQQAGSVAGNVAGGFVNALGTALAAVVGYKTAGPWGAAAGMAAGSTITEAVKAGVSSGVTAWQSRRAAAKESKASGDTGYSPAAGSGSSGGAGSVGGSGFGGGGGSEGSIGHVKQNALAIGGSIAEGDTFLANAIGKVDEARLYVAQATDGSTSGLVSEIENYINQVLEAAGESQTLAVSSRGQITTWVGKI